jgi:hypothetical protein
MVVHLSTAVSRAGTAHGLDLAVEPVHVIEANNANNANGGTYQCCTFRRGREPPLSRTVHRQVFGVQAGRPSATC